jgi:hypothetical protein
MERDDPAPFYLFQTNSTHQVNFTLNPHQEHSRT